MPIYQRVSTLKLRPYKNYLRYEREHNLGKMPLKIDFLVIKKDADIRIKNDIGDFFLRTNIFEYKSPGDAANTGTFYKALSYACLYKSEEENGLGKGFDTDMTISIVREAKPAKLLKQIGRKYSVEQKAKGIYRVSGLLFPVQFIVTKELDKDAYVWVSSLTRTMDRENARRLLGSYAGIENDADRQNAGSVVNVASEANIKLFKKMIQEGDRMCDELAELLAPEIVQFKVQLADKDTEIARLKKLLADKDTLLADKDTLLANKDAILKEVLRLRQ